MRTERSSASVVTFAFRGNGFGRLVSEAERKLIPEDVLIITLCHIITKC